MSDEFYMNLDEIGRIANQYQEMGAVLKKTGNSLSVCMTILKTSGLVGQIGEQAMSRYMEGLEPLISSLSERSLELGSALNTSANAYENGDAQGSTRFY
ncbi:MAG: type VII secretion target [Candidatus Promineifilaceae bacterium]